ncbi:SDR family NAD(P)-dependent oxidoreductase [Roseomonas stagni]|uniref:SDR family NAD(P)-dependent oxidoreductase n=1 Tax=Falsiroseomonas algicola TaxID=2716930 RepID=A0A6M1LFZ8_9PROT|nr:oxidoreductase [Falsiroseomonas algicola]NGM19246.1 SDR family NAD(P)-dependent oxidoreductase [Falsiroseomonas algicola]
MTTPDSPVWFITGAATGFGRAFALETLARGGRVLATARDPSRLADLVAVDPARVLALALDVTRPGDAATAVEAAMARFGRIDTVVNNAGFGLVGAVEETPLEEFRAALETMVIGAVAVTQAALPVLRAQGSGAVVNISSMGGQLSFAGFGAYSAAKFALEGMSEALAQEVAPLGIKVLIVEPGAFRTDFAGAALRRMPGMEAYAGSVGPIRAFAEGMHGTQAGDPAKAARAVHIALAAPVTPLRLALGQDAIDAVRGHAQALLAEMDAWAALGADTRVEAG